MKIVALSDKGQENKKTNKFVAALGFFDGVHLGHRKIIGKAVRLADELGCFSAVWMIADSESYKGEALRLTSEKDKLLQISALGVDFAFIVDFSEISAMSGECFVTEHLKSELSVIHVVCGYNFRFGAGAAWGTKELREICEAEKLGCSVEDAVKDEIGDVSSTRIRTEISVGNMEKAAELLGRPYSVKLPVLHGKRLGRTLGFPTVNQLFTSETVCPPSGVYAVEVSFTEGSDKKLYAGAANIGRCPTVTEDVLEEANLLGERFACGAANAEKTVCETYIVGYSGDLYGKEVRLRFISRIRGEEKFKSLDELKERIKLDAKLASEKVTI